MVMSVLARQNAQKWPNFRCHRLHNQCLLSSNTTGIIHKQRLLSKTFGLKFQKKMILISKSHKSENFILSPAVAMIPNIQWKIALMFFTKLAFMKLSSPLGIIYRGC